MTSRAALVLALTLLAAPPAPGQARETPFIIGTKTTIASKVLGEARPLWIHVPDPGPHMPRQKYPVIYLLDGEENFTELTGIMQRLAATGRMPYAIIVALPNTKDRTHDLTPRAASDSSRFPWFAGSPDSIGQRFPTQGGADRMLAFMTDELMPWVDRRYPAAPYRILIGHSFGGLFTLNALARRPDAFRSYVALSPSLWWDNGRYGTTIANQLARAELAGTSLYMTTGGAELDDQMIAPARALAAALEQMRRPGFRTWYQVMPGESHNSNPHRSMYAALETIFSGFEAHDSLYARLAVHGDSMPVVTHYRELSRRFGFDVPVPLAYIDGFAKYFLQIGKPAEALRMLEFNAAHAPTLPSVHASLADAFDAAGRRTDALRERKRAAALRTPVRQ